jgi:hypothetical protein
LDSLFLISAKEGKIWRDPKTRIWRGYPRYLAKHMHFVTAKAFAFQVGVKLLMREILSLVLPGLNQT